MEEARGARARAALDTIPPDDAEFVESGLELVSDGVHTRSSLIKGKPYKVSAVCVGTGTVSLVIGEREPQSIACDGVSVSRRVQNAPEELPIEITAASGSSGMIAWQITAVPS
ncbi:hypothetical protein ACIQF5_29220 [Streptomyces goshikiensis]|uniref:hypothetical protein n=1 Tax=Streptomyces goshikiensis TaxID=1942 RepID=UPI00380FFE71